MRWSSVRNIFVSFALVVSACVLAVGFYLMTESSPNVLSDITVSECYYDENGTIKVSWDLNENVATTSSISVVDQAKNTLIWQVNSIREPRKYFILGEKFEYANQIAPEAGGGFPGFREYGHLRLFVSCTIGINGEASVVLVAFDLIQGNDSYEVEYLGETEWPSPSIID